MSWQRILGDAFGSSNPSISAGGGLIPDSGRIAGVTSDIRAWTPLNPALYMRYFTEFHNNPVTKAAFREKINTGFAGGFSIRLGPYSQKSDPSLDTSQYSRWSRGKNKANRKYPSKGKGKARKRTDKYNTNGPIGKNGAVARITKDEKPISHGAEIEWIESLMEKAEAYRDMYGMIAFRRRVNPMNPSDVRIEIIEAPYGYFVGKMGDDGRIEYGFVLHSSRSLGVGPGGKTDKGGTTNEPDSDIKVFVWPGQEPIVGMSAPFRSSMSSVYSMILEMKEMWQNELEADYKRSHPVWVTQNEVKAKGPADITEHELFLEVTGQLNVKESRGYHERARMNAEMSSTASAVIRDRNQCPQSISQRRLGLGLDNTETVITRLHSYQDNHYVVPMGTSVGKGPETRTRTDLINIMDHKIKIIAAVFGVPLYSVSTQGQGRNTAVGSRGNMDNFRRTLVEMRKNISLFVEHAYLEVIGKEDKQGVADLVTDISMSGNREEVMVRKYVQEIIKGALPQEIMERYTDAQKREMPIFKDLFTKEGLGKEWKGEKGEKGGKVTGLLKSLEEDNNEMAAYYPEDMEEVGGLSAGQLKARMEARKIFQPREGAGKSSSFHDPKSALSSYTERNSMQQRLRNLLMPGRGMYSGSAEGNFSRKQRQTNRKLTEPIPIHIDETTYAPFVGDKEIEMRKRYEREIQDHLDEISYRDKLEEAKWRQLTARENLYDNRVSRLLAYALNNYKVALNPELIRNALEKYTNLDPSLDPSKAEEFTILSRSKLTPIEEVENVIVEDVMSQRKEYMKGILDDPKPLTIIWDSAPIPDVELIIKAGEKGLLPSRMVGRIISNEMGIEDVFDNELQEEEYREKEIENFLKRNKERLGISIAGGRKEITSAMQSGGKEKKGTESGKEDEKEKEGTKGNPKDSPKDSPSYSPKSYGKKSKKNKNGESDSSNRGIKRKSSEDTSKEGSKKQKSDREREKAGKKG